MFFELLDAIIGSRDKPALITPDMMQAVTARCADIVPESRWYGVPAKVLEVDDVDPLGRGDLNDAVSRRAYGHMTGNFHVDRFGLGQQVVRLQEAIQLERGLVFDRFELRGCEGRRKNAFQREHRQLDDVQE